MADVYEAFKKTGESFGRGRDRQIVGLLHFRMYLAEAGEGDYREESRPDEVVRTRPAPDAVLARTDGHRMAVEISQLPVLPQEFEDRARLLEATGELATRLRSRLRGSLHILLSPEAHVSKVGRTDSYDRIANEILLADEELAVSEARGLPMGFTVSKVSDVGASVAFHDFVPGARRLHARGLQPNFRFMLADAMRPMLSEAQAKLQPFGNIDTALIVDVHAHFPERDPVVGELQPLRLDFAAVRRFYILHEPQSFVRIW